MVHADEFLSPDGHPFDKRAFDGLINDPEIKEWIEAMNEMALLPRKR
jgi:hypothetical protein